MEAAQALTAAHGGRAGRGGRGPMDGTAAAIRAGRLSFAFLEASPYHRWAVPSGRTYRQVSEETGVPLEVLRRRSSVTEPVAAAAAGEGVAFDLGELRLKGFSAPVRVLEARRA